MDVQCNRELLLEKLETVKRLVVSDPANGLLLLPRRSGTSSAEGAVKVLGVSGYSSVGVMTEFPATVAREGAVLLPVEPLREYIEALRSETVQLWRQAGEQEKTEGQPSVWFAARRNGVPLQVESSYVSERGQVSSSQAQLCTWQTTLESLPPIEAWLAAALPLGAVEVNALRRFIRQCSSLANARTPAKAGEMYGNLLRMEAGAIRCWATTGYVLASKYIPLAFDAKEERYSGEVPPCDALFSGAELHRLAETLPEEGMVSVTLVADLARPVLIVRDQQMIWFCRSTGEPVPTSWPAFSSFPATHEFLVDRRDMRGAVSKLCVGEPVALSFQTRGRRLCLKTFERDDVVNACESSVFSEQEVSLLVAPMEPIECHVDPRQLKQVIERSTLPRLRFQLGKIEREYNKQRETVPFLRVLTGEDEVMMSLSTIIAASQHDSTPTSSPGEAGGQGPENERDRADAAAESLPVPVLV